MNRWHSSAKCGYFPLGTTGKEMEERYALFHPHDAHGKYSEADIRRAGQFCDGLLDGQPCPVKADCLEFGLTDPHGIYAGMGPDERKALRERRARAARRLPKVSRSKRECIEPGRSRSVERHIALGERLCLVCAEFDADQSANAVLDEQVLALVAQGRKPTSIARELGLTRDTAATIVRKYRNRQLRQEVAA